MKLNREVRKGDTFICAPVYRVKATKQPIDLTGCTVDGMISKDGVNTPFICSVLNPTEGRFEFRLASSVTSLLEKGTYSMFVRLTFSDGTVKTLITGNFVVWE